MNAEWHTKFCYLNYICMYMYIKSFRVCRNDDVWHTDECWKQCITEEKALDKNYFLVSWWIIVCLLKEEANMERHNNMYMCEGCWWYDRPRSIFVHTRILSLDFLFQQSQTLSIPFILELVILCHTTLNNQYHVFYNLLVEMFSEYI